ncbi:MAG TPA: hypothetical protein VJB37_00440 [Patescibacteria group bacterium]|nr:hypothetical protein [Patescibacteria group bacterium]
MVIKTEYGYQRAGSAPYVIVAPHAAGDDLLTGRLARKLARHLGASLVVNNKYLKPNNSRAKKRGEMVEDFNVLSWSSRSDKYLWKKKKPAMKVFYQDIAFFCQKAKETAVEKPLVVYIHGFRSMTVGLDIGVGAKNHHQGRKLYGSLRHADVGGNTGEITTKISTVKLFSQILTERLQTDKGLGVTVGCAYSGWSRLSGIQFHRHSPQDEYAMQLEVGTTLRQVENQEYLVQVLTEAIKKCFPPNK